MVLELGSSLVMANTATECADLAASPFKVGHAQHPQCIADARQAIESCATISIGGTVIEAPLVESRSYLENCKCILYLERGRIRFEMRGRCDSENYGLQGGGFDAFLEGRGKLRGTMTGIAEARWERRSTKLTRDNSA